MLPAWCSSRGFAVGARRARVELTQHFQFLRRRRRRLGDAYRIAHRPPGMGGDLLARHPRMDRDDRHLLALGTGLEHGEIGDELGRALGRNTLPRAVAAALAVAERGDEVELLDEAAPVLAHDDEDLAA